VPEAAFVFQRLIFSQAREFLELAFEFQLRGTFPRGCFLELVSECHLMQ